MEKINLLSFLAIVLLLPTLVTSCNKNNDLIGEYEVNKNDTKKLIYFEDDDVDGYHTIKLSLEEDDKATLTILSKGSIEDDETGEILNFKYEMECSGKWNIDRDFKKSEITNGIMDLVLDDYDINILELKLDGEVVSDEFEEEFLEAIVENEDEFFEELKDMFGTNLEMLLITDNGFSLTLEDGDRIRFKRVE